MSNIQNIQTFVKSQFIDPDPTNLVAIASDGMFGKLITIYNIKTQDIYFLAKQLAEKLDYYDTGRLTRILDVDEFRQSDLDYLNKIKSLRELLGTDINPRGMTLVNEDGSYHAAFASTKPEAKVFRRYVTSEVLPSIRKTGSYSVNNTPNNLLESIQLLFKSHEESQSLQYNKQLLDLEDRLTKKLKVDIEFKRHGVKSPRSCTDIDGFVTYINSNNNLSITKQEMHTFLRTFGFMDRFSTMPTELGLNSNALGIESIPIIYQDGSVGKSTKTVIYTDMFKHAEEAFLNFNKLHNSPNPTSNLQIN